MTKINRTILACSVILPGALLCACNPGTPQAAEEDGIQEAAAVLEPTDGNAVTGTVQFIRQGDGVRVVAEISGLTPGEHGFHIHEHGDCSAMDGTSAGGHFNPDGQPHGSPDAAQHHRGDLGNLTADGSGIAKMDRVFEFLKLNGTESIVGRGLIIHADADDLTTQPTGNAGARVACGVILAKEAEAMR